MLDMEDKAQDKNTTTDAFHDDDDDDVASLSDMPLLHGSSNSSSNAEAGSLETEFKFPTATGGQPVPEGNMCSADQVFFEGKILPMKPSAILSQSRSMHGSCLLPCCWSSSSSASSFSRSSSVDTSISRSHSSHSSSASSSLSSNFYSHPSPKMHLHSRKAAHVPRRRSTSSCPGVSSTGWGLLRFGLVRAVEIELLPDVKQRKPTVGSMGGSKRYDAVEKPDKKASESCEGGSKTIMRLLRKRFGCRCSKGEGVVEPMVCSSSTKISSWPNSEEEDDGAVRRRRRGRERLKCLSSRTFQWLEELAIAKPGVP